MLQYRRCYCQNATTNKSILFLVQTFPNLEELSVSDNLGLIKLFSPRLHETDDSKITVDKVGFSLDFKDYSILNQFVNVTHVQFCRFEERELEISESISGLDVLQCFQPNVTKITIEKDTTDKDNAFIINKIRRYAPLANIDYIPRTHFDDC